MALTVDTIESVLKARVGDYIKDMGRAKAAFVDYRDTVSKGVDVGARADAGAKAVVKAEETKQRAVKKTAETEEQAQARIATVIARTIERDNQRTAAAERNAARRGAAYDRELAAAQSAGMRQTGRRTPSSAGGLSYDDIRSDQLARRGNLQAAAAGGDKAAALALKDQSLYLKLINDYKRQGLSATEAQTRAEQKLADVARRRSDNERRRVENDLRRNSAGAGPLLAQAAGALGAVIGVREISRLNDKFIEFTNQLKIAGVEGQNFKIVQDALFNSANKYGVEIGVLGSLFGKATQAGREFGATQEQNLKFANAVAAAVKVQGGTVQSASGAILQLTQALQSGNVRAQEFNSLLNGLFPILQAAANASDKYGGSVAKLRKEVLDGTLTSKDFFDLILKGSDDLEKKAANAALTTAAGFTVLTNQLTRYFGEADKASGVSATLGAALKGIGDNLDVIIPAIGVVTVAIGTNYVIGALAATNATTGLTGAMTLLQRLPIIAVITALGAAMIYLATAEARANAETAELARRVDDSSKKMLEAEDRARRAGVAVDKVGSFSSAAAGGVDKLGNSMQTAAGKAANLAEQLKRVALAENAAAFIKNDTAIKNLESVRDYRQRTYGLGGLDPAGAKAAGDVFDRDPNYGGRLELLRKERAQILRTRALTYMTASDQFLPGSGASGGGGPNEAAIEKSRKLIADLEKLKATASGKELATINKRIAKEQARIQNLEQGVSPAAAGAALAGFGSGAGGKKLKPLSEIEEDNEKKIREIDLKIIDDKLAVQDNAEKRKEVAFQALRDEYDAEVKRLADDENFQRLSKAQRDARLKALGRLYGVAENGDVQSSYAGLKIRTAFDDAKDRDTDQAARIENEIVRDRLRDELAMSTTRQDRLRIQNELLDLEIAERKRAIEREKDQAKRADDTKTVEALDNELKSLDGVRQRGRTANEQDNEGPLAQYTRQLRNRDFGDQVEGLVVDELQSVEDGIADALSSAIGTKDPLINGLIRLLIQDVLLKPIAEALSQSGGAGGGDIFGSILKAGASIFGGARAGGGTVSAGKFYKTNEYGTEGYASFAQPGRIIPLGEMNGRGGRGNTTVNQTVQVDARNSVNPDGFARQILSISGQQAQQAASQMGRIVNQGIPQRMQDYQVNGT